MTGKTHQAAGIAAGLGWFVAAASPMYSPATLAAVLVGSHLAALIPDADRPAAKIWTSIPYGRTIGRVADPFIKHRNISHSLLGAVLAGLVTYWLLDKFPDYWGIDQFYVFGAVMVAYLSHLLLDAVTSEGIPILFPFLGRMGLPPKPFDGVRIVTGKWFENYVIFPVVNVMLIAIVVVNWGEIRSVLFK